jgi:DNA (cytosine-5)-methyltransferase 1
VGKPKDRSPKMSETCSRGNWLSDGVHVAKVHKVAGLFAGIGGLERGLARAGHETLLLCENDPAAAADLKDRFDSELCGDIRELDGLPGATSIVVAGFPCQDLSQAGKTAGISGARSGLVGEVFRLIEAHDTPWVLLENVPFMLQLSSGRAMEVITSAFEQLGYKWAYRIVDSRCFGLPQRRRRVYFLASKCGDPREVLFADDTDAASPGADLRKVACGFYWTEGVRGLGWAVNSIPTLKGGSTVGIPSAPAIVLPDGTVGTPDLRDAERLQGFPVNWTRSAESVARHGARWKLVGNAVNVRAAEWIGKRLAKPGKVKPLSTKHLAADRAWPNAAWNVGQGRVSVAASEWPVHRIQRDLQDFLLYPLVPLSERATAGFLRRAESGGLRFPPDFLQTLRSHLDKVSSCKTQRAKAA